MIKALEQLRIETLKNTSDLVRNHNETCCAICIENFETGSQVRYLTCGHPYHKKVRHDQRFNDMLIKSIKCIDPWLIEKGSCPQCKVDVLKQLGLRDGDSNETTVNFSVTQQPTVDMVCLYLVKHDLKNHLEHESCIYSRPRRSPTNF